MRLQRATSGRQFSFSRSAALTCGGEGCIYPIPHDFSLLAKIYHQPNQERARKLACMVAHPLDDPMAIQGHVSVAWPVDLLRDIDRRGQVVGFLMRRVNDLIPIVNFYNPSGRRQSCPLFNWYYLHQTARNLAAAFAAVHKAGDLIADVNSRNILASQRALVTLVDTDSFQVRDPENNSIYRCPVGTAEYTPPELQTYDLATVDRNSQHDCFGLAIILFQLLMEGTHPFAGIYLGTGDAPPYEERIRLGHFPYSSRKMVPYRPMPVAPPLNILYPLLQHLFVRCFDEGHRDPASRPDALAWQNALEEAEAALIPCHLNTQHRYSKHLTSCPWCERTKQLGGRDPFPSTQAVQRGQHLHPRPHAHRHQPKPTPRAPAYRFQFTYAASSYGHHKPPSPLAPRARIPTPSFLPLSPTANRWLLVALASCFTIACFTAGDWKRRVLYGLIALSAGTVRWFFAHRQIWPKFLGLSYTLLVLIFAAGVITPQVIEVSPFGLFLFGSLVCFWLIRGAGFGRLTLKFITGYGAFAVIALITAAILGSNAAGTADPSTSQPVAPSAAVTLPVDSNPSLRTLPGYVEPCLLSSPILCRMEQNSSNVEAVAWSPDGTIVASASLDGTVKLWNAESGELLRTLNHNNSDSALLPKCPTTSSIASCYATWNLTHNSSGSALLPKCSTPSCLPEPTSNDNNSVYALAWSPDGKMLASGSWDGIIKIWNGNGSKLLSTLNHFSAITSLAWRRDGKVLASSGLDGTIRLWNPNRKTAYAKLNAGSQITSLAWSPDGQVLVNASLDKTIKIWDANKGKLIRTETDEHDSLMSLAWSPDGKTLASAGEGPNVRLWVINDERSEWGYHTLAYPITTSVRALAWSPDSRLLASVNTDHGVAVWDAASGILVRALDHHANDVPSLVWSPDGKTLAIADDNRVVLWDVIPDKQQ